MGLNSSQSRISRYAKGGLTLQIVLNLIIIMVAALSLLGLLSIKISERFLINQKIRQSEMVASSLMAQRPKYRALIVELLLQMARASQCRTLRRIKDSGLKTNNKDLVAGSPRVGSLVVFRCRQEHCLAMNLVTNISMN